MEITIFAKRKRTIDGKPFTAYFSQLVSKTGEVTTVSVKFRETAKIVPSDDCPMNILVNKADCNLSRKQYIDINGNAKTASTLWISAWEPGEPYVDHSMDEFF